MSMQKLDGHWVAKRIGIIEHYKNMTAHEIALFDVYCLLANKETFYCYRTLSQLEEILGWDRKTIIKARKGLEKIGFIEMRGKTGVYIPKLIKFVNEPPGSPDSGEIPPNSGKFPPNSGELPLSKNPRVENFHRKVEETVLKSGNFPPIIEDELIDDSIYILERPPKSENSRLCKLSDEERQYLSLLKSIPNYPFNFERDLSFIRDLLVDFPTLDLKQKIKDWKTWLLDKNPKGKINYRSRLRRWLTNSLKYQEEKKDGDHRQNDKEDDGDKIPPFSDIPPELLA